jgi:putative endonuclease
VLVVCEVKTRSSIAYGHPHEAVTATKLARLTALGMRWQESHGVRAEELRIDLVCVVRPRKGPSSLDHVRGVL